MTRLLQRAVPGWRPRLAAALAAVLVAACGGGGGSDSGPAPAAPVGTVSGVVLSAASGAPLAGVAVRAGAPGATAAPVSTGADGRYSLSNVPAGDPAVVVFELSGHAKAVASVPLADGGTALASPRMVPVAATQTFDAAAAATVTVAGSPAQVVLPAAGLVNAATGAAASGTVTAEITPINPATDPGTMPGNYSAIPAGGGAVRTIESFGAVNVTLRDAAGNALNLASGQRATLRIPLATRSADVPASIPLWYFNESTGLWVEEGTATLAGTAPNQYYEGTVGHFSYWNADRVAETIRVTGCLRNSANNPVADAQVHTVGVDYSGQASATTDAQGRFSVAMRRNSVASLFAELDDRVSNVVQVGPSQTDIVLESCLVLRDGGQPPVIIQQPQSTTQPVGGLAMFEVQAVGSGVLRYQWLRNGVNVGSGIPFHIVNPVAEADQGARFTVVVSNAFGSVTSDAAVLSVDVTPQPPVIDVGPQSARVAVGGTATFTVFARSQGGTLGYQWRRNGVDIPGATASSHTTPAAVAGDDGSSYSVRVSSRNGTSVLSATATLNVDVPALPVIVQQPQNATVGVGQAASFSVSATGATTYQWLRGNQPIVGATQASYTTPATAAGDNGAVFSVQVGNATGTVTSATASLSVTVATPVGGYYLVASAGPTVDGSVTFANGTQAASSQALLAVSSTNPSATPVTLAPAGQAGQLAVPVFQATISASQVTAARSRFTVFTQGNRFYKVDQDVAGSGVPQAVLLSTLTTNQVCGSGGSPDTGVNGDGNDLADPAASWFFARAPGADGLCGNADDTWRAVRVSMSPTDAAITLAAEPLAPIRGSNGGITGFVVRSGNQIQRVNADLGGAVNLFTVGAGFANGTALAADAFPGVWFFVDAGSLQAVNLSSPATRSTLLALNAGETLSVDALASDGEYFVPLETPTSTRLVRVTAALQASVLANVPSRLLNLHATTTHVVGQSSGNAVLVVPRSGGAATPLLTLGATEFVQQVAVGASTVAVQVSTVNTTTGDTSSRVQLVNSDGSNPQSLANTALLGSVAGASVGIDDIFTRDFAVYLADNVSSPVNMAASTLRALALDTRSTLVTYGSLPATPSGSLFPLLASAVQYGAPGLMTFVNFGGTAANTDLYHFDSDAAGLTRVTTFVTGSGGAPQVSGRVARPAAAAGRGLSPTATRR